MLNRISPRALAATVLSVAAVLIVIGSVRIALDLDVKLIDLDQERTIPATFSGLVLGLATLTALVLARIERSLPLLGLTLVLWWMGFDEMTAIHERLQDATEVSWHLLYLPFLPVVVWIFVRSIPALPPPAYAGHMFVGGIGAWILSQVFDVIQNKGAGSLAIPALVPPEEFLEICGSLLFVLALLTAVQARLGTAPVVERPAQ